MAATPWPAEVAAAQQQFLDGRGSAARTRLEALLASPAAAEPAARVAIGRVLLDLCLRSRDAACASAHVRDFVETAGALPVANVVQRGRLALEAAFYLDAAQALQGVDPAKILAEPTWGHEVAYDGDLYLRRQVLASNLMLRADRRADLDRSLNKILSLTASLTNPEAARLTVAASLADVIATLLETGETERAYGLYRAGGAEIAQALPPKTLHAASFQLTVGQLLIQVGDLAGARRALSAAIATLQQIELGPEVRTAFLAPAATLKAVADARSGDVASAQAGLAAHPSASLYATGGRAPASADEVAYLAARSYVGFVAGAPDSATAQALQRPAAFTSDPATAETVAVHRAAGEALALPPGPKRDAILRELGRRMREAAARDDKAGRLGRLGAVDQLIVSLALSQTAPTPGDATVAFDLFQLAGRTGTSFDADALAALGQAPDELARRTVHQALRLEARRDRLEREGVQKTARAMLGDGPADLLHHYIAARGVLRDYDERLARAETRLSRDGVSLDGPRLTPLARLQAVLAPDEAALAVAPTLDGLAYMCVRRDRTFQAAAAVDTAQMTVDAKIVQAALTASYAPSPALDVQFPAEAAVRLYAVLLKPFDACLRPGDRIVWLGGVVSAHVPLAALLPAAPPRLERGYDLAAARWVVRDHAVSYAGSAVALVAERSRAAQTAPDYDFLGVGDPSLAARAPADTRFDGLAPLPETALELQASSRGFRAARLLLRDAATEASVRSQVLGGYRYLSFATHGLLREDVQGLSDPALVLTPAGSSDPRDDGLLTAAEIADMNLDARFVALSACNTANADYDRVAQDMPALASAFAVSGVPATLGTLWPVNSTTGQAVVAGLFDRLRNGKEGPAAALAEAQRAFLMNPPEQAYLHPRFWAPFVVLGDGDASAAGSIAGPRLTGVETLSGNGGEVLALAATPAGLAARFIAEPDAAGRPGEGVALRTNDAETWRQVGHEARASRVLARLGERLVAGGYEVAPSGRLAPRLDAYAANGQPEGAWHGATVSKVDAGFLAATPESASSLLVVIGERARRQGEDGGGVQVLRVGPDLAPSVVAEVRAPPGALVSSATVTPLGRAFLLTYTASNVTPKHPAPNLDDYDAQVCAPGLRTWAELRETASGRLLQTQAFESLAVVAAAARPGGGATIAGSRTGDCDGERHAMVAALDSGLKRRDLYQDETLGASEVRALAARADGGLFAAAYKESLFEPLSVSIRTPGDAAHGAIATGRSYSVLALTLDAEGRATAPPKLIEAGADVLPTAALAGRGGEILIGGSLAGRAAIFHLSTGETKP